MSSTSPDHSQHTIDARIDDIQIEITDLLRKRLEDSGLSLDEAAARMQVDLSSLTRVNDPRTALRLSVPQAIDVAHKAGLDLELQATIELDGLTLFHGGALKRSAYADATAMMAALEAEAARALQAHLALNGLTIEDYIEAIKHQRDETLLDFARATGAERMLALLDFRGCKVEIASRIYDAPEANILADPKAARTPVEVPTQTPAQDDETAALRDLIFKRFGGGPEQSPAPEEATSAAKAAPTPKAGITPIRHRAIETLRRFGEAPEDHAIPKKADPEPVEAPQTPEQARRAAGEASQAVLMSFKEEVARAFAAEVRKTGMSTEEVASALDIRPVYIKQICSKDWQNVSLNKTLEIAKKIGLDIIATSAVVRDGSPLPQGATARLADHATAGEFLYAVTQSLQPAVAQLRQDIGLTNDQIAVIIDARSSEVSKVASPKLYKVAPLMALSILHQFGCTASISTRLPSVPSATIEAQETPAPASSILPRKPASPNTAPRRAVGKSVDIITAHQTQLIGAIRAQIKASGLSNEDVARRVKLTRSQLHRALQDKSFTLPLVLTLASSVGIDSKTRLRVSYQGRDMGSQSEMKASDHANPAEYLASLAQAAREALRDIIDSDGRTPAEFAVAHGISQPYLSNLSRPGSNTSPQSVLAFIEKTGAHVDLAFRPSYDATQNLLTDMLDDIELVAESSPAMRR